MASSDDLRELAEAARDRRERNGEWQVFGMPKPERDYFVAANPQAILALLDERDRLRDALQRIVQWSDAYPLTVFPEPDFARAAVVLAEAGMTLDAISASNMRHAISGAGEIARVALAEGGHG